MKFFADRLSKKQIHKRRWYIHAVMSLGLILIVMAVSSLNVALPTLVRELGATATDLQWIVNSYAIVFAGLLLFAGALGDRFGRRGAFIVGLLIVAFASLMAGFADNSTQLIAWRAVTGIGAALVMPATLSIITNVFAESKERTKAVALWAGFAGAGASIGPVVSGLLLENYWWGSIFLINIPVALLAVVLTIFIVPDSKDPEAEKLDFFGALLSIVGLCVLLYGIIEAPNFGWLSVDTFVYIALGLIILIEFYFWERMSKHPMLPVKYFKSPSFSYGGLTITLAFFAMFGMFFVIVQYMQFVLGYSALKAAVATLPLTFALIFVSAVVPRLVERFNMRNVIVYGLVIAAAGLLFFTTLQVDSEYLILLIGFIVLGVGMAMSMPPATDALIGSVPGRKAGIGSAMNDTTREFGGALGIAILGSILASEYRNGITEEVKDLPTDIAEAANESIGSAQIISFELGDAGQGLFESANQAFTDGMTLTFIVGAVIMLITAAIIYKFMPTKVVKIKE